MNEFERMSFKRWSNRKTGTKGIIAPVSGPFRQGMQLEGASITDIAPTVLYMLGHKAPEDVEKLNEHFRSLGYLKDADGLA